jgi:hypothetical protein
MIGAIKVRDIWLDNLPNLLDEKNRRTELCHGLSSAAKAISSEKAIEISNECRRACGGNGMSLYSNFGYTIMNEINTTWEGDNNVLIQQCAKFILRNLQWLSKGKTIQETCEYLTLDTNDKHTLTDYTNMKHL